MTWFLGLSWYFFEGARCSLWVRQILVIGTGFRSLFCLQISRQQQLVTRSPKLYPVYLPTTQRRRRNPLPAGEFVWFDYQPFVNSFFVLSCFGTSMGYFEVLVIDLPSRSLFYVSNRSSAYIKPRIMGVSPCSEIIDYDSQRRATPQNPGISTMMFASDETRRDSFHYERLEYVPKPHNRRGGREGGG